MILKENKKPHNLEFVGLNSVIKFKDNINFDIFLKNPIFGRGIKKFLTNTNIFYINYFFYEQDNVCFLYD